MPFNPNEAIWVAVERFGELGPGGGGVDISESGCCCGSGGCATICGCPSGVFTGFPFVIRIISFTFDGITYISFTDLDEQFDTFDDLIDSEFCDLGHHIINVYSDPFENDGLTLRGQLNIEIVGCLFTINCYLQVTFDGGTTWQNYVCSEAHQFVVSECDVTADFGTFNLDGIFNFCTIPGGDAWVLYIGTP